MRIIISGGGTGGHIYPAIAIADELKKQNSEHEILFVGAQGKMEMDYVPSAGYDIIGLPIRGISRRSKDLFKNIIVPFRVLDSLWKARKVIKKFKPDIVIGTGGYASFSMLYMAAQMHVPTLLQEQNAYPGIVNRLLAKYANKICVAYEHLDKYFPANKVVLTGNPIRSLLVKDINSREASCNYFGLQPNLPTVLILGGSQGAKTISNCVLQASHIFNENGVQVILSTGRAYFKEATQQLGIKELQHFKVLPYIERMDLALSAASIVVSRAGALSITEIAIAHKPAIFIPSPYVAADHQTKNILPLVERNAAIMVREDEMSQNLIPNILKLAKNLEQQKQLAENIGRYARPKAAASIVDVITDLLNLSENKS